MKPNMAVKGHHTWMSPTMGSATCSQGNSPFSTLSSSGQVYIHMGWWMPSSSYRQHLGAPSLEPWVAATGRRR